jgi:hypothetical protein
MLPFHDVSRHLSGLWLLIRGDARGLSAFDISDQGVARSFLAILWCLPAIVAGWMFKRAEYAQAHPRGGDGVIAFMGKMFLVEIAQWIVPVLAICLVAVAFGLRPLLRTLIVTRNWFTVPLVYASYVTAFPASLALDSLFGTGLVYRYGLLGVMLAVLVGAVLLYWRLLTTVVGGSPWLRASLLGFTVLTELVVVSWLEASLGVTVA